MFGIKPRHHGPSQLRSSAPIFAALCQGRSSDEKKAIGKTFEPQAPFVDSASYMIDGRKEVIHTAMPFAVAAVRHGDLDLFHGMVANDSFFLRVPYSESLKRQEYEGAELPKACACEALAHGRLDIFDAIESAAKSRIDLKPSQSSLTRQESGQLAASFLRLDIRSFEEMLSSLARSPERDQHILSLSFERVAGLLAPDVNLHQPKMRSRICKQWLDAAIEHGNEPAARSAIACGAEINSRHILGMARNGLLELAGELAPSAPLEAASSRQTRNPPSAEPETVCEAFADSLSHSMRPIADGFLAWNDPSSTSREWSWAEFSDHAPKIREMALLALAGSFDIPGQTANRIAKAKAEIFSCVRALGKAMPDGASFVAELAAMEPQAPATAAELIFIARAWPQDLEQALLLAPPAEVDEFTKSLIRLHADPKNKSGLRPPAPDAPSDWEAAHFQRAISRWDNSEAKANNLGESLFVIYDRQHLMTSDAREDLLDYISRNENMSVAFEARSISLSASTASKSRKGPLRV